MPPPVRACRRTRHAVVGLLAIVAVTWATAAPSDTPPLPQRASSPEGFVPPGWYAERLERADFDADGRKDLLLLLRRRVEPGAADPLERVLAVAFARRGGYALAFADGALIPRIDSPYLEDPLADGELKALRQGLRIRLVSLAGAGSYAMATVTFTFRLRDGCFRLVTYDRTEVNRASLDTTETTVDYSSGLRRDWRGNAQSNRGRTRTQRIAAPRICIEAVGSAWTFAPGGAATR